MFHHILDLSRRPTSSYRHDKEGDAEMPICLACSLMGPPYRTSTNFVFIDTPLLVQILFVRRFGVFFDHLLLCVDGRHIYSPPGPAGLSDTPDLQITLCILSKRVGRVRSLADQKHRSLSARPCAGRSNRQILITLPSAPCRIFLTPLYQINGRSAHARLSEYGFTMVWLKGHCWEPENRHSHNLALGPVHGGRVCIRATISTPYADDVKWSQGRGVLMLCGKAIAHQPLT